MDKIILDTSFLVSYYNSRDENHNKAKELMNEISYGDFEAMISDYIFGECCTVLLLRLKDFKKTIRVCQLIKSLEMLNVEYSVFERTWELFREQKETKLSFTDCSTLALMETNGIKKIATFDEEFNKIEK
ncbi:MAG: PIN domain-containing protein [Nanoarchaeota archaeon]